MPWGDFSTFWALKWQRTTFPPSCFQVESILKRQLDRFHSLSCKITTTTQDEKFIKSFSLQLKCNGIKLLFPGDTPTQTWTFWWAFWWIISEDVRPDIDRFWIFIVVTQALVRLNALFVGRAFSLYSRQHLQTISVRISYSPAWIEYWPFLEVKKKAEGFCDFWWMQLSIQ